MNIEDIAKVCHEANRAYCAALGDVSQPAWDDAPKWQRKSAVAGVEFHLANPDASPSASHESWLAEKERDGWKYGPVKNPDAKEHPCFMPFSALPIEQQAKDVLFKSVVDALKAMWERESGKEAKAAALTEETYLVWSNQHRAWWRPDSSGYTRNVSHAGRYTQAEALSISFKGRDGWKYDHGIPDEIAVPLSSIPEALRGTAA